MRSIDYVIAALPRSGTHYTRSVFNKASAVHCGHEQYFNAFTQQYHSDQDSVFGDVSWFSAPFLGQLPTSTVVLHQKRDMIKVVESMFLFDQRDGTPGLLDLRRTYANFIKAHCPEVFSCDSYEESLFLFYDSWTEEIKKHSVITYNVEDLEDPEFTKSLIKKASGVDVSVEDVATALSGVSNTIATYGPPVKWAEEYLKNKGDTA